MRVESVIKADEQPLCEQLKINFPTFVHYRARMIGKTVFENPWTSRRRCLLDSPRIIKKLVDFAGLLLS